MDKRTENKPSLSVVIPVYNEEKHLCECIESVINQTKKDIEIILVDDGSTDRSGTICDGYAEKDNRIKVVHQENQGKIPARRAGIKASCSDYITFVDGDDFIAQKSFKIAEPYMDEGIDAICFNTSNYYNGVIADRNTYLHEGRYDGICDTEEEFAKWIYDESVNSSLFQPSLCIKIIKTKLMRKVFDILGPLSINYAEDRAATYVMLKHAESVQVVNKSYYRVRMRAPKESKEYIKDEFFLENLFKYYEFLRAQFRGKLKVETALALSYIQMVNDRRNYYCVSEESYKYLFPYDKVKRGERIVIYGAGKIGRDYYRQLQEIPYCEIILWVDKNYNWYDDNVFPVESINNYDYDRIVISVKSDAAKRDIKVSLARMGVPESKMV